MVKRRCKITGDFGFYESVALPVAVAAAKAVCLNVNDTADSILFLDMLGLIPAQPGNEKVLHKRSAQKEKQEKYEDAQMQKLGVTPEEIGE